MSEKLPRNLGRRREKESHPSQPEEKQRKHGVLDRSPEPSHKQTLALVRAGDRDTARKEDSGSDSDSDTNLTPATGAYRVGPQNVSAAAEFIDKDLVDESLEDSFRRRSDVEGIETGLPEEEEEEAIPIEASLVNQKKKKVQPQGRLDEAQVLLVEESAASKDRRTLFAALGIVVAIVAISTSLALALPIGGSGNPTAPTGSPTPTPVLVNASALLEGVLSSQNLLPLSETSAEAEALRWILEYDPSDMTAEQENVEEWRIIQRFAAAHIYFATEGSEWSSDLKFLSAANECDWNAEKERIGVGSTFLSGLICTVVAGRRVITRVRLAENRLRSKIPWSLSLLTDLEIIDLPDNRLTGTIPSQLVSLTKLQSVDVAFNLLTGAIPGEVLGAWQKGIKQIRLSSTDFDGTIPSECGLLTQLDNLRLDKNSLSGLLPTDIGKLSTLQEILINDNRLTGSLPTEYDQLLGLTNFDASKNQFTGSIPANYQTNWRSYKDEWFADYEATQAPSFFPSLQPSSSQSPSASQEPTIIPIDSSFCFFDTRLEVLCPDGPLVCQELRCREQPYRMEFEVNIQTCSEAPLVRQCPDVNPNSCLCIPDSSINRENTANLDFACSQSDLATLDETSMFYFVASSDISGASVYSEGQVAATRDRFTIVDPDVIKLERTVYMALYTFDEETQGRGEFVQRVSWTTRCEDDEDLKLFDSVGSFQLTGFESLDQMAQAGKQENNALLSIMASSVDGMKLDALTTVQLTTDPGLLEPVVTEFNVTKEGDTILFPYETQLDFFAIPDVQYDYVYTISGTFRNGSCSDVGVYSFSCPSDAP